MLDAFIVDVEIPVFGSTVISGAADFANLLAWAGVPTGSEKKSETKVITPVKNPQLSNQVQH